jgi:hypothetical protein
MNFGICAKEIIMTVGNFTIEVGGWVPRGESVKDTLECADWDIIKHVMQDRLKDAVYDTKADAQEAEESDPPSIYRKFNVTVVLDVEDFKTKQDGKAV